MNTQSHNNRFISECLCGAFAEHEAAPARPQTINQPRPAHRITQSRAGQATVVDAMLQRFTQFGVTVPQASFFGRPVGEVIATLAPGTPPTAPAAVNPTRRQSTFVMPAGSVLPLAA